ncbi:Dyp-type peroxidase family [Cryptosporangium aurantiacum]|uniref:Dyp-type peroxidase family n=1 Tax=Cryptosporangium aurantiacum TaxID=134849 RepID=A0A1M7R265_9ACTN|nr:Dyp-type peroxidase family [Cryptosporangium aurantiacum]
MTEEPLLPDGDIQGDVLAGFRKDHARYLFYRLEAVAAAKASLAALLPRISPLADVAAFNEAFRRARSRRGEPAGAMTAVWINVAFSRTGLAALAGEPDVDAFADSAFKAGMRKQSRSLGDAEDTAAPGHPNRWLFGGGRPVDAVVTIAADDPRVLSATHEYVDALLTARPGGWTLVHDQPCATRREQPGHEHFGFRDGISQPAPRGRLSSGALISPRYLDPDDPRAEAFARPGSPLVWPGEFVLGLPRQSPARVGEPAPAWRTGPSWAVNGSFLVIRRLSQDVDAFRRFCRESAAALAMPGVSSERLAALLVGRWPSGAPISRSPEADDPALGRDDFAANDFGFASAWRTHATGPARLRGDVPLPRGVSRTDGFPWPEADTDAVRCPTAAHIRKINPRDEASDVGGAIDNLRRTILRRGLPFGPSYDSDPAAERGLLFACYQASIVDQFAKLTNSWVQRPAVPRGRPPGHDLLLGQGEGLFATLLDAEARPHTVSASPSWVTPTGGEYFFTPSITAIRNVLAAPVRPAPERPGD